MTEQIIPSDDVILKAVHDTLVISTTDLQGVITYANDLFCKLTGYSREELVGKPHNLVRHPSVPKEVYKDMWDTIQAGKIWTGVIPNVGKGGVIYVVDTTVQMTQEKLPATSACVALSMI
nr:PAS domain-containing protein [Aggregatibacter aphrophilus]